MNVLSETLAPPSEEVSLLDIFVAMAESWMLLVLGPLVVGLSVLAFIYFGAPDRYVSTAILQISPEEAALLESASVIDPAVRATDWARGYGTAAEARRAVIERALTTEKLEDVEYFRVSITGRSPESAHALLRALVSELIRNSAPRDDARAALEQKLEALERSAEEMKRSLVRLNALYDRAISSDPSTIALLGDAGQSYATLISRIAETEQEIVSVRLELEGSVSSSDIVQQPTLEKEPLPKQAPLAAAMSALATAVVLLLFVFVRASIAHARQDARSARKIRRIRRALRARRIRPRIG